MAAGQSVSGLYGPLKSYRERELSKIFASGQTLRLQFPKEDLGFVYDNPGAAIHHEPPSASTGFSHRPDRKLQPDMPAMDATATNTQGRVANDKIASVGGSDRRYRPSCAPGGRLPHCMLQQLNAGTLTVPGPFLP